jgi:alpha-galactosidase
MMTKKHLSPSFRMCLPAMGWNSWNTFTKDINETLIKETADALVSTGLKDAGYDYVVIDDCWSLRERDGRGRLVADPDKFPSGMKALADYIHGKGLKFGMYSCAGTHTCAGYPGSFEHEFTDAKTFASWGVDYLKYDYCFKPAHADGENLYKRMDMALRACGRPILFSACSWGKDEVHRWIAESGAQSFRSTHDIQDSWESIKDIVLSQVGLGFYAGPFCHNDMDMLVVGMHGASNNDYIRGGVKGCTDREYQTHFALWAMMGSPLIIGCDVRSMDEATKNILMNPEVIAINQDIECRPAWNVASQGWDNAHVDLLGLWRVLSNGSYAFAAANFSDTKHHFSLPLYDVGLPYNSAQVFKVRNCIERKDEADARERFVCSLESHECKLFRMKLAAA